MSKGVLTGRSHATLSNMRDQLSNRFLYLDG